MLNCYDIVNYIIENGCTASDASKHFDCSLSTIRKAISKLKKSDKLEDKIIYQQYLEVSRKNEQTGRANGGKIGKRGYSISDDDLMKYFNLIVIKHCTLHDLSIAVNIPVSTLSENFKKRLSPSQLSILCQIYEDNQSNYYDNDVDNNRAFHRVGSQMAKSRSTLRGNFNGKGKKI